MSTGFGTWRYLLRDGRFITASVQLDLEHLYRIVCRDDSVIYALLSSQAEQLLLQLIKQTESHRISLRRPKRGFLCIRIAAKTASDLILTPRLFMNLFARSFIANAHSNNEMTRLSIADTRQIFSV